MSPLSRYAIAAALAGAFFLPLSAYALGVPFAGIIDGETPCLAGGLPAVDVNVLGFNLIDVLAPPPIGTLPYLYSVPVIGEYILGLADTPAVCFVGLVPLPGLRMQMFGTSLPGT